MNYTDCCMPRVYGSFYFTAESEENYGDEKIYSRNIYFNILFFLLTKTRKTSKL